MIFKFYGKILLICLIGFNFPSCDTGKKDKKIKGAPVVDKRADTPSQPEIPLQKTKDPTNQGQGADLTPKERLSQDNGTGADSTSSLIGDSAVPGSTVSEGTSVPDAGRPSHSVAEEEPPATASGNVTEAVKTETVQQSDRQAAQANLLTASEDTERAMNFPQDESWKFTLEQVAGLNFLKKGGSDFFHYYLHFHFSGIENQTLQITDSQLKRNWSQVCYESDCSQGIDREKMDQSKIRFAIKSFSLTSMKYIFPGNEVDEKESVIFIQGSLAPRNWDRWLYIKEKGKSGVYTGDHITSLQEKLEQMRKKNIKKIAVNLPFQFHKDPIPFILLGQFIKQKQIDLHIVGGCEHYCATYLIPAARTVYMEPYGYFYRKGNALNLSQEIQGIIGDQKEVYFDQLRKEWLSKKNQEEQVKFVVSAFWHFRITPEQLSETVTSILNRLKSRNPEQEKEFREKLPEEEDRVNKILYSWTETDLQNFIRSLSPKLLESVALHLKLFYSKKGSEIFDYLNELSNLSIIDMTYYLNDIQVLSLDSKTEYTFLRLNALFTALVKDSRYEKYLSVPRLLYNISEKDKTYRWIVLSAGLLRNIGIDIRGENNVEMIDLSEISFLFSLKERFTAKQFLYLDSNGIESCGFFKEPVTSVDSTGKPVRNTYDTEKLKGCLSENESLQQAYFFQEGGLSLPDKSKAVVSDLNTKGKLLQFPLNKDWKITSEQVAGFDFIRKGGSDFFYYYIQFLFNKVNYLLTQIESDADNTKALNGLCYESDCSEGLNPQQAAKFGMSSIIRLFSSVKSLNILAADPNIEESLIFLQGLLIPKEWDMESWLQKEDSSRKVAPHVRDVTQLTHWMKRNKIRRVAVNLPPQIHEDPQPFMVLGEFMKKNQIDLHIMGGCGHSCAAYLIPAARTVYIEPYGYIYHKGNFKGLSKEVEAIMEIQAKMQSDKITEQISQLAGEKIIEFITDEIMSLTNREAEIEGLLNALGIKNEELKKEFQTKIDDFIFNAGEDSIADLTKDKTKEFINGLSSNLLERIAYLFKFRSETQLTEARKYIEKLRSFSQLETTYYSGIKGQDLRSEKGYNYVDFFMFSASLLKDSKYAELFSVPRPFYNIHEKDKPYKWIVPSAELLRSFGINIRGENNRDMINDPEFLSMLGGDGFSEESILYLDGKRIEDCGFFKEEASYNSTEELNTCLTGE